MVLDFRDDLGKRHFEFVFVGFVLGGCVQQQKGIAVLRREVAIFEKLEAISELKPCGKKLVSGEPDRQLTDDGPRQMHLDAAEYDLLYTYIGQVPWQSGSPARSAVETLDWLARTQREGTNG